MPSISFMCYFSEEELEKLSLIVGFNASDSTSGWDNLSGYTIHYSHFTDHLGDHAHSFPLSPGLIPNVYFQNVENIFLGKPFTDCVKGAAQLYLSLTFSIKTQ